MVWLNRSFAPVRTKFRLFPQAPYMKAFSEPETIQVSVPAGYVGPGPADDRMYVVDPVAKPRPYGDYYLPPYDGPNYPPVEADADGHFDYLNVNSREFRAAHMYGSIRFVLDIWESYFGRRIEWHFRNHLDRLELIPFLDWDNAQSGYGFIEAGYHGAETGEAKIFSLNFDVLAHELGHSIIFSQVGIPDSDALTDDYRSFHESSGDLVALISVLHFESVLKHLLGVTQGNLYTFNEWDRIGELSETEQIRLACNSLKMSDLDDVKEIHKRSLPLTGAVFDFFVEVFQAKLVERGLISPALAALSYGIPVANTLQNDIQEQFAEAFWGNYPVFRVTLLETRDYVGIWLATAWSQLAPADMRYSDVATALLRAEWVLTDGKYQSIIRDSLRWREILAEV